MTDEAAAERARIVAWARSRATGLYAALRHREAKLYERMATEIDRGDQPTTTDFNDDPRRHHGRVMTRTRASVQLRCIASSFMKS